MYLQMTDLLLAMRTWKKHWNPTFLKEYRFCLKMIQQKKDSLAGFLK